MDYNCSNQPRGAQLFTTCSEVEGLLWLAGQEILDNAREKYITIEGAVATVELIETLGIESTAIFLTTLLAPSEWRSLMSTWLLWATVLR